MKRSYLRSRYTMVWCDGGILMPGKSYSLYTWPGLDEQWVGVNGLCIGI